MRFARRAGVGGAAQSNGATEAKLQYACSAQSRLILHAVELPGKLQMVHSCDVRRGQPGTVYAASANDERCSPLIDSHATHPDDDPARRKGSLPMTVRTIRPRIP